MENTELKEKLFYKKKNALEIEGRAEKAYKYSEGYVKYLDASKTEREAVIEGIKLAEKNGFKEYTLGQPIKSGDKLYFNNRGKNLYLISIGSEPIENGIRIAAAHVDSPRLDLKQCPLYEEGGMGFLKTHYYGGIKKYQWVATPLSLHGVVVKDNGESVNIVVGEDENDPVFYINDILPHLGAEQSKKPLGEAIPGEKLNLLSGSRPYGEGSENIKFNILKILNEKYGITEEDFLSSELCAVPAAKSRDVGFDRSMIVGYGHDDRVCAYPAMTALFDNVDSKHTLMCVFADKEEVGSNGLTGMQSDTLTDIIDELSMALNADPIIVRSNSKCLSADVSAAFDPNFAEVYEKRNAPIINHGVVLNKYTGARGKSGTNDASAEYIAWLRATLAKNNVVWQTAEMGKVDAGGGGTVAMYISKHNIDTVDMGVPVISMHAPYEVIAKADLYETALAFDAFFK